MCQVNTLEKSRFWLPSEGQLKNDQVKKLPSEAEKPSAGRKIAFLGSTNVNQSNKKDLNQKPLRNSENDDFEKFEISGGFSVKYEKTRFFAKTQNMQKNRSFSELRRDF